MIAPAASHAPSIGRSGVVAGEFCIAQRESWGIGRSRTCELESPAIGREGGPRRTTAIELAKASWTWPRNGSAKPMDWNGLKPGARISSVYFPLDGDADSSCPLWSVLPLHSAIVA